MINKFFFIIKRIVVSALMLYSFNVIVSSLEFSIPINFINVIFNLWIHKIFYVNNSIIIEDIFYKRLYIGLLSIGERIW